MVLRLLPLAVLAAITSPTAIAAVLVILTRPRAMRLLTAYAIGSFLTSVVVGVAVVVVLRATSVVAPSHRAGYPLFELAVGVLILVSAAWLHSERSATVRRRVADRRAQRKARKVAVKGEKPSRSTQILTGGSVGLVAALGVAMHLPGLLYLAGLGQIAHADASAARTLLLIVVFNVVMLAPIELPLLGYIVVPQRTERAVQDVNSFIQAHRAAGALLFSAIAGGYLIVSAIVALVQ